MNQSTARLLELGLVRESAYADSNANFQPIYDEILDINDEVINENNELYDAIAEKNAELRGAKTLFDRSEEDNTKAINKIVDIGEQFDVTRDQLLGREQPAPPRLEDLTAQDLSNLSIEELQSLAGGEQ